jgi:hypothetical protein
MTQELPRGIWYEAPKRRFRVRKYHNGVSYLKGYYRTFEEAEKALEELQAYLDTIPKERKKRESSTSPDTSLSGTSKSIRARQKQKL